MSDALDGKIRELFHQADLATPAPPPLPRRREATSPLRRWMVPAAGLAVTVAVVVGLLLAQETAQEATVTSIAEGAVETTSVAAETVPPTPTTMVVGGATTPPGDDQLAAVGRACVELASTAESLLPQRPSTADLAREALAELREPLAQIVDGLREVGSSNATTDQLAEDADEALRVLDDFIAGDGDNLDPYDELGNRFTDLGSALAEQGAAGCEQIVGALP